jgi:hypothetical protein
MICIVWSDYDGTYVEKFASSKRKEAEAKITELVAKEEKDDYGVTIDLIVEGKELTYQAVKTVVTHELLDKLGNKLATKTSSEVLNRKG